MFHKDIDLFLLNFDRTMFVIYYADGTSLKMHQNGADMTLTALFIQKEYSERFEGQIAA